MPHHEEPLPGEGSIAERVRSVVHHDLAAARSLVERGERETPSDPDLLTARAFVRLVSGDEGGAEALFSERLALGPDPIALLGLAQLLLRKDRVGEIVGPLARHAHIDASEVHLVRFFVAALDEGRSPASESALVRVLQVNRQYALALVGLALLKRRDLERSRDFCRWALETSGAAPDAHKLAAQLAQEDRDFETAAREIERYRALGGGAPASAYLEGSLFLAQSRPAEAFERYALAASLRPGWTSALRQAGRLALRLKRWSDVERYAKEIGAIDPLEAAALRVHAALRQGRLLEALRATRKPNPR